MVNPVMSSHDFHQKLKKKRNQSKIIESVKTKGKTYTQLRNELKFNDTTLSKHIKELEKRREIKKAVLDGELVYIVGDGGIINPADISHFSAYFDNIKKRGGQISYDYSRLCGSIVSSSLPWGIDSHYVIDKDLIKVKLLTDNDMADIEKLLFERLRHNIKNDKIKRKVENGNLEIGFNINYEELMKSINANSLKYYENMSNEEGMLLQKFDDEPESITKKDIGRFTKLREETYEKINRVTKHA